MADDTNDAGKELDEVEVEFQYSCEDVVPEVMVAMSEKILLEMLRQVTKGADADLVYAEFFANDNMFELYPAGCECECDCPDDSPNDCTCCTCEDDDDDVEDGDG